MTTVSDYGYTFTHQGQEVTWPRVSRILDAYYPAVWTEEARERGRAVHKATYLLDGGVDSRGQSSGLYKPSLDPALVPYVEAWEQFKREILGKPRKHGLLVDQKTGASFRRHQLQTAAYKVALGYDWPFIPLEPLVEQVVAHPQYKYAGTLDRFYPGSSKIIQRCCVYLKSDGTYEIEYHEDHLDEAVFVGLCHAFHWDAKYHIKKERR